MAKLWFCIVVCDYFCVSFIFCSYGVTFLSRTDDLAELQKSPHLGKSLCFSNAEEMFAWLSAIYFSQVCVLVVCQNPPVCGKSIDKTLSFLSMGKSH